MYKKTTSDPNDHTGVWIGLPVRIRYLGERFRGLMERYPKHIFAAMVACILCSGILAFTIMRVGTPHRLTALPPPPSTGATAEMSGIIETYSAIREVEDLQRVIASIVKKDTLSSADSIQLSNALHRFEQIQRTMKNKDKKRSSP